MALDGILLQTGGLAQIFGGRTNHWVTLQTSLDELLQLRTKELGELQTYLSLGLIHAPFLTKGNVAREQFINCGTQRPNVALGHRHSAFNEAFGSHIGQCASVLVIVIILVTTAKLRTDTKVGD